LMFSAVDLDAQARLRSAFDPSELANPGKVLPSPARCADIAAVPQGAWI
jgi:glycolate oxidase